MAADGQGQDGLVEIRTWLPRSARDELTRIAAADGLHRSTMIRQIILRALRANGKKEAIT